MSFPCFEQLLFDRVEFSWKAGCFQFDSYGVGNRVAKLRFSVIEIFDGMSPLITRQG